MRHPFDVIAMFAAMWLLAAMVLDAITVVLDERRSRGELIPAPGWALVESVEIAA